MRSDLVFAARRTFGKQIRPLPRDGKGVEKVPYIDHSLSGHAEWSLDPHCRVG